MRVVFAEGVGVVAFEGEGYAGTPGSAGIASVCGRGQGGSYSGTENLRMSMLLGGAEKMSPTSSMMMAMRSIYSGEIRVRMC